VTLEIDLWLWSLDRPDTELTALARLLSPDEADRAARFVYDIHRQRFQAGRGRMREILASYVNQTPDRLVFHSNPQGKPALAEGPQFNLSHSGGWAALAVTAQAAVGVDIEAHRDVDDGIARRFFSEAEHRALSALPARDWATGFFRCWTRKEAVIKAIGLGMSMPLDSFDVTLGEGSAAQLLRLENQNSAARDWTLLDLPMARDMAGAIAVQNCGAPVRLVLRTGTIPLAQA